MVEFIRNYVLNFNYLDGLILASLLLILAVLIAHIERVQREKEDFID